ncbi:MAG TPA: hypothetical protein VF459_12695 [Caulobacteraceae bacterium]
MANELIPWDAEQPYVLHALIRKRAEIAGQIEYSRLEQQRLLAELDHVDAVIHIFNPSIEIARIRLGPVRAKGAARHPAHKGDVIQIAFDCLREATEPLSAPYIAKQLMQQRGLNLDDRNLSAIIVNRVCACLRAQRRRGLVRNAPHASGLLGWELVR